MNTANKKPLSKLVLSIPAPILQMLESKVECKSVFNLNKYLFFTAAVYTTVGREITSSDIYKVLGVNNSDGNSIKKNLIAWGIIEKSYDASFKKNNDGTFFANNSSYYSIVVDYAFKKKIEYIMYSDKAKFINHGSVFSYLNGAIVEAVNAKELKLIKAEVNRKRRERYSARPKVKATIVQSTSVPTVKVLPNENEYQFINEQLFTGFSDDFISRSKQRMISSDWSEKIDNVVIGFRNDKKNKVVTIKRIG
jgi:hypothetical protein